MELQPDDFVLLISKDDTFMHVGTVSALTLHKHDRPSTSALDLYGVSGRQVTAEIGEHPGTATRFQTDDSGQPEPQLVLQRIARSLDHARSYLAEHPESGIDADGNSLVIPRTLAEETLPDTMLQLARAMGMPPKDDPGRDNGGMLHNFMHNIFG